jgi:hypothetical protein
MEIEINGIYDNHYRVSMLRKLNGKADFSSGCDSYGVDGSGGPIELRHINSDTIDGLVTEFNTRINKFFETDKWMRDNFPQINDRLNDHGCGIHIHMFHKRHRKDDVVAIHTIVASIINSFMVDSWKSRTSNGYGYFFANRPAEWCGSNYATELRMLNSITPKALEFYLKTSDKLLSKLNENHSVITLNTYNEFRRKLGITISNEIIQSRPDVEANNLIAYAIESKLISLLDVARIQKWCENNKEEIPCVK